MSRSLFFSLLDLLTWFLKEGKENKFTDMTSRRKKKGGGGGVLSSFECDSSFVGKKKHGGRV